MGTLLDLFHGRAGVLTYNVERGGILWEGLRDAPVIGDAPVSFVILQTSVFERLAYSWALIGDEQSPGARKCMSHQIVVPC